MLNLTYRRGDRVSVMCPDNAIRKGIVTGWFRDGNRQMHIVFAEDARWDGFYAEPALRSDVSDPRPRRTPTAIRTTEAHPRRLPTLPTASEVRNVTAAQAASMVKPADITVQAGTVKTGDWIYLREAGYCLIKTVVYDSDTDTLDVYFEDGCGVVSATFAPDDDVVKLVRS